MTCPKSVVVGSTVAAVTLAGAAACARKIKAKAEAERVRIAVQLHDGPLQEIAAVLLLMELNRTEEAQRTLMDALNETRSLIFQLWNQEPGVTIHFDRERS